MEISQEVLDKLKVRHGRDMSSDVIGLHFSLAQPPIMLAPKSTTFEAKTTNYEDVLAELQSLAQARSFTAYISGTDLPLDRAYDVSWMIEEEAVKSPKGALRIDDMYKGVSSEVVTWEQLCSRPPMYGAVGPDIPPSADADASRTVAESSKKRRLDESAAKPFDMEELANKVQDLQLSHDNFRQEHDDTVKTVREERDRIDKKVNELRDTHDEQIYELELDFDQLRTETDRKLEGDYHWIHGEMKGLADQAARLQIVVDGLQRTVDAVHGALNSERAE
ncbi:uncharacterized protein K452DRAFT_323172 [Aplosporella prunicola CBS 121167]|uniref:Uncharacterized protein n=1 Tax=Aplosporella prunicola CBS 121167 TaxID=1176127 RepID=A0A6A6AVK8_9PEZI|nr:uncharacterized protein K452DRAFT_323172 [Aplosporella prunicola CBS 121167]KAF2135223.1 hypothetical protein K452DRAFT_323172 [Aplosporella prunicola CBS 121167]